MPEIAFNEYKTTEYIRNAAAQYPVQEIDLGMDTGYVCFLDAGAERTVALRADIDAVPAENGAKHLCGHDVCTVR
jgi:metal-dependent amidase/aminoacylase/carboxypeptidase family protein